MFNVKKEKIEQFTKIILINSITKEYISIIPDFGANVNEIILFKNNKLFSILDGYQTYSEVIKNKGSKGAKLVPFPNRINSGSYIFNNNKYQLPINFLSQGHAIHGLIYNKKFNIKKISTTKTKAYVILEYNYKKEISGYPFSFKLKIKYSLDTKGFNVETTIKNTDSTNIPVGDGWHPYFKIGNNVEDLFLKLPTNKKITVNKRMIPTGKYSKYNKFDSLTKIGKTNFDTGFVINKNNASTVIYSSKQDISLNVWQNNYNYLQVFIPPLRNSIAIEPMSCNTDAFNNKKGLIILKPKENFKASYGVFLS
jgi:aldose 1-epimerase